LEIIPAIDIIDGKCVRLTQGDYDRKTVYNDDPLEVAKAFEAAGIRRLHLVDLDGAKAGAVKNWRVLEAVASKTKLVIDFGGGIKTKKGLDLVFQAGAAYATIGSLAVKDQRLFSSWLEEYGTEKFLLGADVKDEKIAVSGWLETTSINVIDFIRGYVEKGMTRVFCTDISKDGQMEGPSLDMYETIIAAFPTLKFIASGGVSSVHDLDELQRIGCSGAIVGKAFYEGKLSLEELSRFS
jgi:phosphoribosylformimino-5-aminoimidazole carboxamide ribotide isomerase